MTPPKKPSLKQYLKAKTDQMALEKTSETVLSASPVASEMIGTQQGVESDDKSERILPVSVKHKRRFCNVEGCTRIVKSQGRCQRHGAKPKLCTVMGCQKQAQGSFSGMCKLHFKNVCVDTSIPEEITGNLKSPPSSMKPWNLKNPLPESESSRYTDTTNDSMTENDDRIHPTRDSEQRRNIRTVSFAEYLRHSFLNRQPFAWHRRNERRARNLEMIQDPTMAFQKWELELIWSETIQLDSHPSESSFAHLAYAWGRSVDFHQVVVSRMNAEIMTTSGQNRQTKNDIATHKSLPPWVGEIDPVAASLETSTKAFLADLLPAPHQHEYDNNDNDNNNNKYA